MEMKEGAKLWTSSTDKMVWLLSENLCLWGGRAYSLRLNDRKKLPVKREGSFKSKLAKL